MRQFLGLLVIIFVGTFVYSVASRLAGEGRALLIGVLIGVASSIPAALLAALAVRAAAHRADPPLPEPAPQPAPNPGRPPVVIVNPPQGGRGNRYATFLDGLAAPRQPRSFKVVGDGDSTTQEPEEPNRQDYDILL